MAVPLFEAWQSVSSQIEMAAGLFIAADFDGTLARLVDDPCEAHMPPEVGRTLAMLSLRPQTAIAIVSGRTIEDVRAKVGLDGLVYSGNHGQEIVGPLWSMQPRLDGDASQRLSTLAGELTGALKDIPGAFVEFKRLSLAVHYRQAPVGSMCQVGLTLARSMRRHARDFRVCTGKDVYEVIPPGRYNKGRAVGWILDRLRWPSCQVVCIGDDHTDEDMFTAYGDGITIKVGAPHDTSAKYFVDSPKEVHRFLRALVGISPACQRLDHRLRCRNPR